jgi:hypothetical protein
MTILLNGVPMDPPTDPRVSLLDFVREGAHLFWNQERLQPS